MCTCIAPLVLPDDIALWAGGYSFCLSGTVSVCFLECPLAPGYHHEFGRHCVEVTGGSEDTTAA